MQGRVGMNVDSRVHAMAAHHSAVAPEAAGVHESDARPGRVRQQPHLRRQRVLALPLVNTQRGQPELAPGGDVRCASASVDLSKRVYDPQKVVAFQGRTASNHGTGGLHEA